MGAIRLFLAWAVAFEHFNDQILSALKLRVEDQLWLLNFSGVRSVMLFYVISGFLISYTLERKYSPNAGGTLAFFRARALRIYPLWWFVLALSMVVTAAPLTSLFPGPAIVLVGLDWLLSLWDYPNVAWDTFLSHGTAPAWSLGAEVAFYLMAPWVLRRFWLAVALFVASAVFRYVSLQASAPFYNVLTMFLLPSTLMFFLLGHFAQRYAFRFLRRTNIALVLLVAAILFSCAHATPSVDDFTSLMASICFALSLPGIFAATKNNRIMNFMGDLTYPLYLTHSLVIMALVGRWEPFRSIGRATVDASKLGISPGTRTLIVCGIFLGVAVATAVVVHLLIERPLQRLAQIPLFGVARKAVRRLPSVPYRTKVLFAALLLVGFCTIATLRYGLITASEQVTAKGDVPAEDVPTQGTELKALPGLPALLPGPESWDFIVGLKADPLERPAVAAGQRVLRLVGVGDAKHALGARFRGLAAGRYRATAWVKAGPGVRVMIEARDGGTTQYGVVRADLETRGVIEATGDLLASGVEVATDGWVKVWADLRSEDGEVYMVLGLLEGPSNFHEFEAGGQRVIFGGFDVASRE